MTLIHDVTELQNMNLDLAGDYELANDIDASATATWNATTNRGAWAQPIVYAVNDYVTYGGSYYVCKTAHTSSLPFAGAKWRPFYSSVPNAYLGFLPIGDDSNEFTGNLDGKGFQITGLFINRYSSDTGLFGFTEGSIIQNVSLVNVNITGRLDVGALIGSIYGEPTPCTITNCSASGTVNGNNRWVGGLIGYSYSATITDCHSSCTVVGADDEVGGFIGQFDGEGTGTITRCYSTGNVTCDQYSGAFAGELMDCVISECYATGSITGGARLGGFVGDIDGSGTYRNCYSKGAVTASTPIIASAGGFVRYNDGGTIENCYSTGAVSALSVGGFCENNGGTITDCFWDTQTSGTIISDGGTGKTTAQMKTRSTFSVWDFSSIWSITTYCNNGYPCLLNTTPNCALIPSIQGTMVKEIIALEAIRNIEMSCMGRIYVDEEGNLTYESRYARNP